MKSKHLCMLTGLGTSGLLATGASAELTAIVVEEVPNEFASTCDVYAQFDNPNDAVVMVGQLPFTVGGTPALNISIGQPDPENNDEIITGTFYQHPLGGDSPPDFALVAAFPSLEFDTYVTIGAPTVENGGDTVLFEPAWAGFGASTLAGTNVAWMRVPEDTAVAGADPQNRVLLGRFSTQDGTGLVASFTIKWRPGDGSQFAVQTALFNVCHEFGCGSCTEGDAHVDNLVDTRDLLEGLLANWTRRENITFSAASADFDNDGDVGPIDLIHMLKCYGGPAVDPCDDADLDGDGVIGVGDLCLLVAAWGPV